jgi:hypothetical protein
LRDIDIAGVKQAGMVRFFAPLFSEFFFHVPRRLFFFFADG